MLTITIPRWTGFALAVMVFVGFWALALSGSLPVPQNHHQPAVEQPAKCTSHDCRQDASADALVFYTEVLAFFTAILAIVSAVQGVFLYRADGTARIAANAASDTAKATLGQLDEVTKQKEISRLQYYAANRPRLEIRFIKPTGTDGNQYPAGVSLRYQYRHW